MITVFDSNFALIPTYKRLINMVDTKIKFRLALFKVIRKNLITIYIFEMLFKLPNLKLRNTKKKTCLFSNAGRVVLFVNLILPYVHNFTTLVGGVGTVVPSYILYGIADRMLMMRR